MSQLESMSLKQLPEVEGTARMSEQNVDQKLVERVQRGDKNAFNLLVTKYQHKVANLVSRYVKNHSDVPDIVQEAFIKAYRALPNFRGDSAFYTWLYRIAVNCAKNHMVGRPRRICSRSQLDRIIFRRPRRIRRHAIQKRRGGCLWFVKVFR